MKLEPRLIYENLVEKPLIIVTVSTISSAHDEYRFVIYAVLHVTANTKPGPNCRGLRIVVKLKVSDISIHGNVSSSPFARPFVFNPNLLYLWHSTRSFFASIFRPRYHSRNFIQYLQQQKLLAVTT
jgi:hypothetical protein